MLILLMLVGLRARVCMHPYDSAAVATDCKQTNICICIFSLPHIILTSNVDGSFMWKGVIVSSLNTKRSSQWPETLQWSEIYWFVVKFKQLNTTTKYFSVSKLKFRPPCHGVCWPGRWRGRMSYGTWGFAFNCPVHTHFLHSMPKGESQSSAPSPKGGC
jgi:hypothetical protein